MRPLIFKDKSGKQDKAAKQAFYREAKAHGMTCKEYREALAAGLVTPPPSFDELLDSQVYEGGYVNKGWFGQKGGGVTYEPKTHIASTSGKHVAGVTACGKFHGTRRHEVRLAADGVEPTCAKCRAIPKITPPSSEPLAVCGFTKAQMREVLAVLNSETQGVTVKGNKLIFDSAEAYQRIGKLLIERLEDRSDAFNKTQSDYVRQTRAANNGWANSDEARKKVAEFNGVKKACFGALWQIVVGADDEDIPDLQDWYDKWRDARSEARYAALDAARAQRTVSKVTPPVPEPAEEPWDYGTCSCDWDGKKHKEGYVCPKCVAYEVFHDRLKKIDQKKLAAVKAAAATIYPSLGEK